MTASFLPLILPDELIYSFCAAYHYLSGNRPPKETRRALFSDGKSTPDLAMFGSQLTPLVSAYGRENPCSVAKWIWEHTLYPLWGAFRDQTINDAWTHRVAQGRPATVQVVVGETTQKIFRPRLVLCLECVMEDTSLYGRPYWHRSHQPLGVALCHRHHTPLVQLCASCGAPVSTAPAYSLPSRHCQSCGAALLPPIPNLDARHRQIGYAELIHATLCIDPSTRYIGVTAQLENFVVSPILEDASWDDLPGLSYLGTTPLTWLRDYRPERSLDPHRILALYAMTDTAIDAVARLKHSVPANCSPNSREKNAISGGPPEFGLLKAIARGDDVAAISETYQRSRQSIHNLIKATPRLAGLRRKHRKNPTPPQVFHLTIEQRNDFVRAKHLHHFAHKHGFSVQTLQTILHHETDLVSARKDWIDAECRRLIIQETSSATALTRRNVSRSPELDYAIHWLLEKDKLWLDEFLPAGNPSSNRGRLTDTDKKLRDETLLRRLTTQDDPEIRETLVRHSVSGLRRKFGPAAVKQLEKGYYPKTARFLSAFGYSFPIANTSEELAMEAETS